MFAKTKQKEITRARRRSRIRAKVHGTKARPRLAVHKSNRYVRAQLIDDDTHTTIVGMITRGSGTARVEHARQLGKQLAEAARQRGIDTVVFDRGGYVYTGKIKALADGACEGGLSF